jgi:8-oxo-dGTP diphosphatase
LKREYPVQPVVGVGIIILDCGRLVLMKRGAEPSLGKWSFPGGAVELGESVRDAAVREAKEECGLNIKLAEDTPLDAYDIIKLDDSGHLQYHYVLLQFLANLKEGTLKPTSDVKESRWVPLEEVEKYDLTDSVRLFFGRHLKELKKL